MPKDVKCGCLPRRNDPRTLSLAKYMAPTLPAPPQSCGWGEAMKAQGASWGMMNNDQYGCCVEAAKGHTIQVATSNNGPAVTIDDATILRTYMAETGGVDSGLVILDSLNYWRQYGLGGHRIDGYGEVSLSNQNDMKTAIFLLGAAFTGVSLPKSTENMDTIWDLPRSPSGAVNRFALRFPQWQPGSRGGHCVAIPNYGPDNRGNLWLQCITWGDPVLVSWEFFLTYFTESYGVLLSDWVANVTAKVAPSGFDHQTLLNDLGQFS